MALVLASYWAYAIWCVGVCVSFGICKRVGDFNNIKKKKKKKSDGGMKDTGVPSLALFVIQLIVRKNKSTCVIVMCVCILIFYLCVKSLNEL